MNASVPFSNRIYMPEDGPLGFDADTLTVFAYIPTNLSGAPRNNRYTRAIGAKRFLIDSYGGYLADIAIGGL